MSESGFMQKQTPRSGLDPAARRIGLLLRLWHRLRHRWFLPTRGQQASLNRRGLQRELRFVRRQLAELQHDHAALVERNASVETLSAELMRFNIDLSQVSRLDAMTSLLNRAAFEACLTQEHALAVRAAKQRQRRPYTVIMIDVDHFKAFNDSLGHPAGDACLVAVAKALQSTVRRTDYVGRYGGEEMIVLCPEMDAADGRMMAERLRASVFDLRIAHPASPVGPRVTVSVGVATGPGELLPHEGPAGMAPPGWTCVLQAADARLYEAKHAGRDRVAA